MLKITFMRNTIKYIDFAKIFKKFFVFSIIDIRKIYPAFQKRRLYEWQKKGYIIGVSRGYYIFSDSKPDEHLLFYIANRIRLCSYISLETALFYYQLIPESVFSVTSVSTKKTIILKSKFSNFIYKTISPKLFFGYDMIRDGNYYFRLAKPEKALIDYFYLNPNINTQSDFKSLRINSDIFNKKINKRILFEMLRRIGKKSLDRRMSNFMEFMKNA